MNNAGQVVGVSYTRSGVEHGFLWDRHNRTMTDLNSLIANPAGRWEIEQALDIDSRGDILARAIDYAATGYRIEHIILRAADQEPTTTGCRMTGNVTISAI